MPRLSVFASGPPCKLTVASIIAWVYLANMTAKRWLFCVGLFLLAVALVVGQGFVAFILAPFFMLAVAFGVIYGAVRLAIRHETRRAERRDQAPPGPHVPPRPPVMDVRP